MRRVRVPPGDYFSLLSYLDAIYLNLHRLLIQIWSLFDLDARSLKINLEVHIEIWLLQIFDIVNFFGGHFLLLGLSLELCVRVNIRQGPHESVVEIANDSRELFWEVLNLNVGEVDDALGAPVRIFERTVIVEYLRAQSDARWLGRVFDSNDLLPRQALDVFDQRDLLQGKIAACVGLIKKSMPRIITLFISFLDSFGIFSEDIWISSLGPHRQIVEHSRLELTLHNGVVVHRVMLENHLANFELHVGACRVLVVEAYESEAILHRQLCLHHDELDRLASLHA